MIFGDAGGFFFTYWKRDLVNPTNRISTNHTCDIDLPSRISLLLSVIQINGHGADRFIPRCGWLTVSEVPVT